VLHGERQEKGGAGFNGSSDGDGAEKNLDGGDAAGAARASSAERVLRLQN